jgi:hypothetical protein
MPLFTPEFKRFILGFVLGFIATLVIGSLVIVFLVFLFLIGPEGIYFFCVQPRTFGILLLGYILRKDVQFTRLL